MLLIPVLMNDIINKNDYVFMFDFLDRRWWIENFFSQYVIINPDQINKSI